MKAYSSVTEYIAASLPEVRPLLKQMRAEVKSAVPKATESIKYGMPTLELNGENLVHYAAMKGHLGFYPSPSGITAFKDKLASYDTSKGCIRFSYAKPVPYPLIKQIVRFRTKQVLKSR